VNDEERTGRGLARSSRMRQPRQFAVIDVETNALSPRQNGRILEIALILADEKGTILDRFTTLVNPGDHAGAGAVHIHGIQKMMLQDAPFFDEIIGNIVPFLENSILTAHNISFDKSFLLAEFARAGIIVPTIASFCTLKMARKLFPHIPSRSLSPLCGYLGIPLHHAHSAMADCMAALQLLRYELFCIEHEPHLFLEDEITYEYSRAAGGWPARTPSSCIKPRVFESSDG